MQLAVCLQGAGHRASALVRILFDERTMPSTVRLHNRQILSRWLEPKFHPIPSTRHLVLMEKLLKLFFFNFDRTCAFGISVPQVI